MKPRNLASLTLALVFALSFAVSALAAETGGTYRNVDDAYAALNAFRAGPDAWVWNKDNQSRTDYTGKLQPMKRDAELEQTAKTRAREIAQSFSHTRPNGQSCFTAYPDLKGVGENIAEGQESGQEVTDDWKETNDPYSGQGHRRNMLSPKYNAVGIACYVAPDGTPYWVQAFGTR